MARRDREQEPNIEGHRPEQAPEREPMGRGDEGETSRDRAEFDPTSTGEESGEVT